MAVKVKELAKELNMDSKELLNRIKTMGIAADSEASEISDIDAKAAKNTILRSKTSSETKIVRATPKKEVKEEERCGSEGGDCQTGGVGKDRETGSHQNRTGKNDLAEAADRKTGGAA